MSALNVSDVIHIKTRLYLRKDDPYKVIGIKHSDGTIEALSEPGDLLKIRPHKPETFYLLSNTRDDTTTIITETALEKYGYQTVAHA